MSEITLDFLGQQMQRMIGDLRANRAEIAIIRDELEVVREEARVMRREMRAGFSEIKDEITVLTGSVLRQDTAREGDRISAAGLLAIQRRLEERLTALEKRMEAVEKG